MNFGKYKGQEFDAMDAGYIKWLCDSMERKFMYPALKDWLEENGHVITTKIKKNPKAKLNNTPITKGKYAGYVFHDMDDGYMQYIVKAHREDNDYGDEYDEMYKYCKKHLKV